MVVRMQVILLAVALKLFPPQRTKLIQMIRLAIIVSL